MVKCMLRGEIIKTCKMNPPEVGITFFLCVLAGEQPVDANDLNRNTSRANCYGVYVMTRLSDCIFRCFFSGEKKLLFDDGRIFLVERHLVFVKPIVSDSLML
jgi:hypothetical protein